MMSEARVLIDLISFYQSAIDKLREKGSLSFQESHNYIFFTQELTRAKTDLYRLPEYIFYPHEMDTIH